MNAKHFSFLGTAILLVSIVSLQAIAADTSKESFKEKWDHGVKHSEYRTKEILQGAETGTKRVGSDIKNSTERVGHGLSNEAHHTAKHWHPHKK